MSIWIGLLLAASTLAAIVFMSSRRRLHMADLGSVSAQWLSEHRGYDRHYSER